MVLAQCPVFDTVSSWEDLGISAALHIVVLTTPVLFVGITIMILESIRSPCAMLQNHRTYSPAKISKRLPGVAAWTFQSARLVHFIEL